MSFMRFVVVVLRFLLLYFMLHNGCVTCHIGLTLIECNLQILYMVYWLVGHNMYENKKKFFQNWICSHQQVTGWGGICWAGSDKELSVTGSVIETAPCQTPKSTSPHPFTKGYEEIQFLKICFFLYGVVDKCKDLLQVPLNLCSICIKMQFPSKQMSCKRVCLFFSWCCFTLKCVWQVAASQNMFLWKVMWLYKETHQVLFFNLSYF